MGSTVHNVTRFLDADPDPFWYPMRKAHFIYELTLATVSITLNSCVVYLALTTRNRTMRNYCWVLLMSVFGDMAYTLLNLFTMEIVEIRAGKMYFITLGLLHTYDYPYNYLMASLWLTGMYITIGTVMMQFVYRYCALCREALTPVKFGGMYILCLLWSLTEGFAAFFCFDDHSVEMTEKLMEHPMYTVDTPAYIVGGPTDLNTMAHFLCTQTVVTTLYIIIAFTARRINQKLKSDTMHMSKATRQAQEKLNKAMMLQSIYPVAILGLPIILAILLAQLQLDVRWSGLYLVTSVSVIPVINAATYLAVIPSFRRRIVRYLPWNIGKPYNPNSTFAATSVYSLEKESRFT